MGEYDCIKTPDERRREFVGKDIELINSTLDSDDEETIKNTHITIDGKYQACIKEWSRSMLCFHPRWGFLYDELDKESMLQNLRVMKPKLESYMEGMNEVVAADGNGDVNVVVNNNTNVSIEVSFENTRKLIEDMPGLTQEQNEELQKIINELEEISKSKDSKKKKWEKVKPILSFVIDKSADVAIAIMSLIMQMKLGMQM